MDARRPLKSRRAYQYGKCAVSAQYGWNDISRNPGSRRGPDSRMAANPFRGLTPRAQAIRRTYCRWPKEQSVAARAALGTSGLPGRPKSTSASPNASCGCRRATCLLPGSLPTRSGACNPLCRDTASAACSCRNAAALQQGSEDWRLRGQRDEIHFFRLVRRFRTSLASTQGKQILRRLAGRRPPPLSVRGFRPRPPAARSRGNSIRDAGRDAGENPALPASGARNRSSRSVSEDRRRRRRQRTSPDRSSGGLAPGSPSARRPAKVASPRSARLRMQPCRSSRASKRPADRPDCPGLRFRANIRKLPGTGRGGARTSLATAGRRLPGARSPASARRMPKGAAPAPRSSRRSRREISGPAFGGPAARSFTAGIGAGLPAFHTGCAPELFLSFDLVSATVSRGGNQI